MTDSEPDDVKSPLLKNSSDETAESAYITNSSHDDEELDADAVLEKVGSWGKFNILLLVVFIISNASIVYQFTFTYFIGNNPSWKCVLPPNATQTLQIKNTTDFCSIRGEKEVHIDEEEFYERCKLPRDTWTYTTTKKYSYTTEFDLICSKKLQGAAVSAAFFCGFILDIFVAPAIDKFGRKPILIMLMFLGTVMSFLCSVAANVWQLIVLRFFVGGTLILTSSIFFVHLLEFVTPASRSTMGCVYVVISIAASNYYATLLAFLVRDWRRLNAYASIPNVFVLIMLFFVPRSPRWLLEKGRAEEAHRVLENAAEINGKCFEFRLRSSSRSETDRTYTYLDLARKWKPFRMTLCLALLYLVIGLLSYQVSLEVDKLGAGIYISFALATSADIPGFASSSFFCDKFGRKKSVLISIFLSGLVMASIGLVSGSSFNSHTVRLSLAMLSKVTCGVANYGFFVWLFESFPTVIRGQGGTVSLTFHQVGIISVPLINTITHKSDPLLVYVMIGVCAVVVSIIGCVLKETNNKPTRETYQDMLDGEE